MILPNRLPLVVAIVAAVLSPLAWADGATATAPEADEATRLDTIVVIANRMPEPLAQVVAGVALVEREEMERRLDQDTADLVRYVPGVRVDSEANRFGRQGFSIRGLGGNRVRVEIDGVPLPDAFAVGQFAAAGRDLVDLEVIERIEVLRGPASTLYGSDALAGIVVFGTRDPESLLAQGDGRSHIGVRTAWAGRDDSHLLAGSWAGVSESGWQGMAVVSRRDGHETGNRAWRAEDAPNPADYRRDAFLGKLIRDAGGWGRWELIADHGRQDQTTEVRSQHFAPGRLATTYRLEADDRSERDRVSLGARWARPLPWLEQFEFLAYGQDSLVRQDTDQYRLPDTATPFESLRSRRFEFEQRELGLDLVAHSRFQTGAVGHWMVYGVELERTRYSGLRDGIELNLETGASSNVILGERMPVRDFPESTARRSALFVQDQIDFGRLAVTPALRWERYRLDARPDAIFLEDYPDIDTVDTRETSLTPRLGLRWALADNSHLFLQYARGFRAPPFSDVNIGLFLPAFNYEVRANPELKPERSRGLEAGWRWQGEAANLTLSAYRNEYTDLIESRANLGIDPVTRALVFQSVNRGRARISGFEVEGGIDLGGWWDAAQGWSVRLAAATARGEDRDSGRPLNSVDPATLVAGLRFDESGGRWGAELAGTGVKRMSRVDESAGPLFVPPGYAVLDAYFWYTPNERVRMNLGLYNLADRRYWDFASLRGLPANAPDSGFYTRPGRSVSAGISLNW